MALIQHRNDRRHFTMVANEALRDARLSFRARGVLAFCLSHEDGFHVTIQTLQEQGTEGRDAVAKALRELEELGYLERPKVQRPDGTFATLWRLSDMPTALENRALESRPSARPAIREDQREDKTLPAPVGSEASTPPRSKAKRDAVREQAKEIAERYWEWHQTKHGRAPSQPFIAIEKVVATCLRGGWDPVRLKVVMTEAGVISGASLDMTDAKLRRASAPPEKPKRVIG